MKRNRHSGPALTIAYTNRDYYNSNEFTYFAHWYYKGANYYTKVRR